MGSRMDRYKENDNNITSSSRSTKNKELYNTVGTNTKYTNFTDVSRLDAVSLTDANKNKHTREGYQQIKKYDQIIDAPKSKRELENLNYLYQDYENKIYDINSVLEEARKNRGEREKEENKRKLKNTNYNILAELNKVELEEYKKEKENKIKDEQKIKEEGLKDLINTITSKTLAGEISRETSLNLLSDLMATKLEDKLPAVEEVDEKLSLSKQILDKESLEKIEQAKKEYKGNLENTESNTLKGMDKSFYTGNMDFSKKDLMDNDFSDDIMGSSVPLVVRILLISTLVIAIALAIFFTIRNF